MAGPARCLSWHVCQPPPFLQPPEGIRCSVSSVLTSSVPTFSLILLKSCLLSNVTRPSLALRVGAARSTAYVSALKFVESWLVSWCFEPSRRHVCMDGLEDSATIRNLHMHTTSPIPHNILRKAICAGSGPGGGRVVPVQGPKGQSLEFCLCMVFLLQPLACRGPR